MSDDFDHEELLESFRLSIQHLEPTEGDIIALTVPEAMKYEQAAYLLGVLAEILPPGVQGVTLQEGTTISMFSEEEMNAIGWTRMSDDDDVDFELAPRKIEVIEVDQSVAEVADAMRKDPETWAEMFLQQKALAAKLEFALGRFNGEDKTGNPNTH